MLGARCMNKACRLPKRWRTRFCFLLKRRGRLYWWGSVAGEAWGDSAIHAVTIDKAATVIKDAGEFHDTPTYNPNSAAGCAQRSSAQPNNTYSRRPMVSRSARPDTE